MNHRTAPSVRLFRYGLLVALFSLSGSGISRSQNAAQAIDTIETALREDKQEGRDLISPKA